MNDSASCSGTLPSEMPASTSKNTARRSFQLSLSHASSRIAPICFVVYATR
jgi:hypothetical protein